MAIKSPLDLLASNFKTSQSLGNWLFPVKNLVELDEESGFDYLRGNKTSARLWLRVMSWQQKERGKKEKRKKLKKSILSYNIGYESMGKRPTLSPSQPVSGQSSAHGKDGGGCVPEKCHKRKVTELWWYTDVWWMSYQRLNSPWLHNVLSSPQSSDKCSLD